MKDLVIYHASCADGFCAAWLHWRYRDADALFFPAQYGQHPPTMAAVSRRIYIYDFSYPREHLLEMEKRSGGRLLVFDHHKTAAKELEGLDFCTFDMEKSGARLAWEFLRTRADTDEDIPWLVNYTEDRDLWLWELPFSREVNAALSPSNIPRCRSRPGSL